jgi:hypothetical protein
MTQKCPLMSQKAGVWPWIPSLSLQQGEVHARLLLPITSGEQAAATTEEFGDFFMRRSDETVPIYIL